MRRSPSTHPISWFLDLRRMNQLNLNPDYQRKSVWSRKDRKFFLDTIFRDYPTPPIFVHREISDSGNSTYHVVDGKQRLETILAFADNRIQLGNEFNNVNLDNRKFNQLPIEFKRKFWDYTLIVDFIEVIDGLMIKDVFDRVNRNSKNLEAQELRHARYNGWFIKTVEDLTFNEFWWQTKIYTRGKDRRMKNEQLMSELLLIILENRIVGFDQEYLDEMYAKYDFEDNEFEDFDPTEFIENLRRIESTLEAMESHNLCVSGFGRTANNLYTLWAYIHFNPISNAELFANRYEEFMSQVEMLSFAPNVEGNEDTNGDEQTIESVNPHVLAYYLNSKGAATEETQRRRRFDALTNYMAAPHDES